MKIIILCIVVVIVNGSSFEGEKCHKDGESGVCIRFSKCPSAFHDKLHNRRIQHCGYAGAEPIVCCIPPSSGNTPITTTFRPTTKRPPSQTTTEYIPPNETFEVVIDDETNTCPPVTMKLTSEKTGQKAWDKCIEYQEKLVFPCVKNNALIGGWTRANRCHHHADELVKGGNASQPNEFPHMALLGYGSDEKNLQWLCGGSLISEKFVLTGAHCMSTARREPVSYVALGVLKRTDVGEHNLYKIKKRYPFPKYDPNLSYHDIALLELEKTVNLNEYTVPACLNTGHAADETKASATGWGHTEHEYRGSTSEVLQKVILSKFGVDECKIKYEKHERKLPRGYDPQTQMCYGDRFKLKDTCQGDSGGPLQIKNKQIACMYTIIGVTSLGKPCVYADTEPGIYTRVIHYLNWIERIVWPSVAFESK